LTAEGTTSKGTGSISCEVEFCIFYRLSLRTLRTKDVYTLYALYYYHNTTEMTHLKFKYDVIIFFFLPLRDDCHIFISTFYLIKFPCFIL
jgi:hypothetical protein